MDDIATFAGLTTPNTNKKDNPDLGKYQIVYPIIIK